MSVALNRRGPRLVAIALAALAATAAPSGAAGVKLRTMSLLAVNHYTGFEGYRVGTSGPQAVGSGFAGEGTLYRWAGRTRGARVGSVRILCTFTSAGSITQPAWMYCASTISLPAGRLELAGFVPDTSLITFSIVGGTGAYLTLHGDVEVNGIAPDRFSDVIHLAS